MGIRIVNNSRLKVVTNIPENYIGRVKKGTSIDVKVLESGKVKLYGKAGCGRRIN